MRILAIDTTCSAGSVALLEDRTVLGLVAAADEEPFSSRLHRDLERLLRETGCALPQVDLYAVATGPGSFTGLRVGLAAVKAWAEVYRKPVAAVTALEAMAAQHSGSARLIAAIEDAHRGQFFAGLYERRGGPEHAILIARGEDVVLPPAECLAYLEKRAAGEPFVIRTTVPDLVRPLAAQRPGMCIEAAHPALAPEVGRLGFARAERGELGDAVTLDAHYVRRSDAELHWKPR